MTNQNCKIVKDISSQYPQKNKLNYYLACIAEHDTIILVSRQNINCDSVFLTPITFGKKYTLHLRFQKNAHNPLIIFVPVKNTRYCSDTYW